MNLIVPKSRIAPHWVTLVLCLSFAILYGVWILPHTVFIRHTCMAIGSVLGLWVIYLNYSLLWQKRALPIALVFLLIIWITLHLFWLGRDFSNQYLEYTKIWKKIIICFPFAVGLGLSLATQSSSSNRMKLYWRVTFFGLLLPAIIYFIKLSATLLAHKYSFGIPRHLVLDTDQMGSPFGISRAWYVFYCLPALAISLGAIFINIRNRSFNFLHQLTYILCIPFTLLIFYIENDRLGALFGSVIVLLMVIYTFVHFRRKWTSNSLVLSLFGILLAIGFMWASMKHNAQWNSVFSDIAVAVKEIDHNPAWRKPGIALEEWPKNSLGQPAYSSNYLRASWAIAGARLVLEHPLGYGLLSLSFGKLVNEKWPASDASWSHSAWLDFTLGYGIPGFLLLVSAVFFSWKFSKGGNEPWNLIGRMGLPVLAAVFLVKEVSAEAFLGTLIFFVLFSSALSLKIDLNLKQRAY